MFLMQGVVDGEAVTWTSANADFGADDYEGEGTPTDIAATDLSGGGGGGGGGSSSGSIDRSDTSTAGAPVTLLSGALLDGSSQHFTIEVIASSDDDVHAACELGVVVTRSGSSASVVHRQIGVSIAPSETFFSLDEDDSPTILLDVTDSGTAMAVTATPANGDNTWNIGVRFTSCIHVTLPA